MTPDAPKVMAGRGRCVRHGLTDDVEGHRQRLAARFPDTPVGVVQAPATQTEMDSAQQELMSLMRDSDPSRAMGAGVGAGYLTVHVIDPSREDLRAIAEVADPVFACVEPSFSGLPPESADRD